MLSLIMYYKQTGGARSRLASWTVPGSEDERYRKDNSYNSSRNVRRCQEMTEQTTVNGQ